MEFQDLQAEADDLQGLALSPSERDGLINDGYSQLVTKAGWLKATLDLTVAAHEKVSSLPDNVYRIRWVTMAGLPVESSDEETVQRIQSGALQLWCGSVYWISSTDTGNRFLSIYPLGVQGTPIQAGVVIRPEPLAGDPEAVPLCPAEFHRNILDYVRANALGSGRDSQADREFYDQKFQQAIADLAALDASYESDGVAEIGIRGMTR